MTICHKRDSPYSGEASHPRSMSTQHLTQEDMLGVHLERISEAGSRVSVRSVPGHHKGEEGVSKPAAPPVYTAEVRA